MKQLTEKQAIEFANSKVYEAWSPRQIAEFQIEQERLCVPFDLFHESVEKTLGRPVFTHEFAFSENLRKELFGEKEPPTLEEIIELIPTEKRAFILV